MMNHFYTQGGITQIFDKVSRQATPKITIPNLRAVARFWEKVLTLLLLFQSNNNNNNILDICVLVR